jgi:hypothetical protein
VEFALSVIGMILGGLVAAGGRRFPAYAYVLERLGAAVFLVSLVNLGVFALFRYHFIGHWS